MLFTIYYIYIWYNRQVSEANGEMGGGNGQVSEENGEMGLCPPLRSGRNGELFGPLPPIGGKRGGVKSAFISILDSIYAKIPISKQIP